jgi:CheY-like chemotaxis protein
MSTQTSAADRAGILLVDDMEDNLDALESILSSLDEPLVRARSGEEALAVLRRQPFAVILLDVRMPGMDGFETASGIRRLESVKDIPIIFMNGTEPDSGYAFRGYATGAADFLTKPFDPWVLRAKVRVFLDLYRKNRQLAWLLACEQEQLGHIRDRLASVEEELARGGPNDLTVLKEHLAGIRDTLGELRRGRDR